MFTDNQSAIIAGMARGLLGNRSSNFADAMGQGLLGADAGRASYLAQLKAQQELDYLNKQRQEQELRWQEEREDRKTKKAEQDAEKRRMDLMKSSPGKLGFGLLGNAPQSTQLLEQQGDFGAEGLLGLNQSLDYADKTGANTPMEAPRLGAFVEASQGLPPQVQMLMKSRQAALDRGGYKDPKDVADSVDKGLEFGLNLMDKQEGRAQTLEEKKAAREQSEQLRRELAAQADETRRLLAGQADQTRRDLADSIKGNRAPSGYRFKDNGDLEQIPGGPATDKIQSTGEERTAAGYGLRMIEAEKLLALAAAENPKAQKPNLLEETAKPNSMVANLSRSPERQKYRQAQEDWVRAKLRKESGAVIADDEMEREIKTYFPQIGDKPGVVAQKAAARATAIKAMTQSAGRAAPKTEGNSGYVRTGTDAKGRRIGVKADGTAEVIQ